MKITVNGHELHVDLADTPSARALADLLGEEGLELRLDDYGGFEKVGALPRSLPTADERITTAPGDVILYQGDTLCLYYAPNTWSFTRLGRVAAVDGAELRRILGAGAVTATLSLT